MIKKYATWTIPAEPAPIKTIDFIRTKLTPVGSMLASLGQASIKDSKDTYMFESDQLQMFNQGFVVYETTVSKRRSYFEAVIHDYALIFLDGVFVTKVDRS